jgi:hypothetical protein
VAPRPGGDFVAPGKNYSNVIQRLELSLVQVCIVEYCSNLFFCAELDQHTMDLAFCQLGLSARSIAMLDEKLAKEELVNVQAGDAQDGG